jgi:hypothetical protein
LNTIAIKNVANNEAHQAVSGKKASKFRRHLPSHGLPGGRVGQRKFCCMEQQPWVRGLRGSIRVQRVSQNRMAHGGHVYA